jgi:hypothetical protein
MIFSNEKGLRRVPFLVAEESLTKLTDRSANTPRAWVSCPGGVSARVPIL